MEDLSTPDAAEVTICAACSKRVTDTDAFCDACGYPLKGTEKTNSILCQCEAAVKLIWTMPIKKFKKAGNVLYIIAILTLAVGLGSYAVSKSPILLVVNIILAIIYAVLGLWSQKKPLTAIISGFALYIIIFLLNAIASPLTIVSGILFKILIVGCFIKGLNQLLK